MDKSRFLEQIHLYRFSLVLGIFLMLPGLWWFYWYTPLLARISYFHRAYKQARSDIKREEELQENLLSEKLAYAQLALQKSTLLGAHGFSRNHLSKELLNLLNVSNLTALFLRTSAWRKKKDLELSIVEIGVKGSFAGCCSFLENMSNFGARLLSCTIEMEGNEVKLVGSFKTFAGQSVFEKPKPCKPSKFSSLRNIFLPGSINEQPKEPGCKESTSAYVVQPVSFISKIPSMEIEEVRLDSNDVDTPDKPVRTRVRPYDVVV